MTLSSSAVADAITAPTASGHTIARIETIPIRVRLPKTFRGSHYEMDSRVTLIIRIHTADGLVGEAYVGDEDHGLHAIDEIVRQEITPVILGEDPMAIERLWKRSNGVTMDILRDRRWGLVAQAGVDAALWDLIGKIVDQPLWRLWGGYSSSIPLIAIGGYYGDVLGTIEDEMSYYQHELGLAGVKFKVGGRSPKEDARRVRRARSAVGDSWTIAVDANQGWTFEEARSFCRYVDDLDLAWFEEPVRWQNDVRSMRDLRLVSGIPICAGQSEMSPAACRDLMEAGAIDYCNFDSSWSGGPTAWRRTAAIADAYDVSMGHHEEPQVSTHLLASQAHGGFAECFHPDRDPLWWSLVADGYEIRDGRVHLSDRAGFGWTLDEDYIAAHRLG